MKKYSKSFLYTGLLVSAVCLLSMNMKPANADEFINLQVLPKNITKAELDKIMNSYNEALGVSCGYCHVKNVQEEWVYHLDDKSEKQTTRKMMRMTHDINVKYFSFGDETEIIKAVTCYTCHYENPIPATDSISMKNRY